MSVSRKKTLKKMATDRCAQRSSVQKVTKSSGAPVLLLCEEIHGVYVYQPSLDRLRMSVVPPTMTRAMVTRTVPCRRIADEQVGHKGAARHNCRLLRSERPAQRADRPPRPRNAIDLTARSRLRTNTAPETTSSTLCDIQPGSGDSKSGEEQASAQEGRHAGCGFHRER